MEMSDLISYGSVAACTLGGFAFAIIVTKKSYNKSTADTIRFFLGIKKNGKKINLHD